MHVTCTLAGLTLRNHTDTIVGAVESSPTSTSHAAPYWRTSWEPGLPSPMWKPQMAFPARPAPAVAAGGIGGGWRGEM